MKWKTKFPNNEQIESAKDKKQLTNYQRQFNLLGILYS